MNFINNLESFGGQLALQDETGVTLTYTELAQKADSLAKIIGIDKRFIFVSCSNNIETIVGYIAGLRGGHVVLMFDSSLDASLLDKLIERYKPDGIWANGGDGYQYAQLSEKYSKIHPDLSLLLPTSGSTGSPKLVKLTTKNLQSNAESIVEYLQLDSSEAPITTLPLHYSYGLSIINSHLLVGAKILLTSRSVVSKEFWDFFKDAQATSLSGVPYTYEMLQRLRIEQMHLPSLRYMTQAGGKLASRLVEHFANIAKDKGVRFYTMYGQTEATARISWLPADRILSKVGSIGVAIPKGEIILEDASGNPINSPEIEGELIYQGENVMMGYAESIKDLALNDQLNGVLRTGDIAKYDKDGFYYITGRLKRFIKVFGNRINLEEIEIGLSEQGFNSKCTGKDNLLVIATVDSNSDQIQQYVIEKYHFHHSIVRVFQLDEFPLSSSGKMQYSELFKKYDGEVNRDTK